MRVKQTVKETGLARDTIVVARAYEWIFLRNRNCSCTEQLHGTRAFHFFFDSSIIGPYNPRHQINRIRGIRRFLAVMLSVGKA
jgi:hypothetical protein